MTNRTLPPFQCTYTPEVPELLLSLNCSLILSSHQAGKIIVLSPHPDGEGLHQLPRNFDRPMGLALADTQLAVATHQEVVILADASELAPIYPQKPNCYDALFIPRAAYFCGPLDLHDIAWGHDDQLWAINTLFSCLIKIDARFSFTPVWQPPFISELKPEDRCHLNGMALDKGKPLYATALAQTDICEGWRPLKDKGGVLIHIPSQEVILANLPIPHSPRLYNGDQLYLLLSATGEIVSVDVERGTYDVINRVPGFVRGLARQGDYLFVGLSKIRKKHRFSDLPITQGDSFCGIVIIHLPTGHIAGTIRYQTSTEEIYDILTLPGLRRPGILGLESDFRYTSITIPDQAFWYLKK